MADSDNNRPAFPTEEMHGDGEMVTKRHLGLTKREYAAIEMAKALVSASGNGGTVDYDDALVSQNAIRLADTLLTELNGGRS